jgi:hypothetical protein
VDEARSVDGSWDGVEAAGRVVFLEFLTFGLQRSGRRFSTYVFFASK